MPKHSIHQPISVGRSFHQKQSLHHFSSVYLCLFNKRSNNHSSETLWLALNLSMFDSLPETATFTHTIDFLRRALGSSEIHNRFLLSSRLNESTVSPPSTLVSVYPVSFTACTTSTPPPPPPSNTFFFLSFKPLLPLILVIQSCLMPRRSITFVFPFKAVYLVGSSFCWPTQFTFCWACWSRTVWVLPSVFALCVYSPFVSSPLPPLLICSGAGKLQCTERIYNHITYCTKI